MIWHRPLRRPKLSSSWTLAHSSLCKSSKLGRWNDELRSAHGSWRLILEQEEPSWVSWDRVETRFPDSLLILVDLDLILGWCFLHSTAPALHPQSSSRIRSAMGLSHCSHAEIRTQLEEFAKGQSCIDCGLPDADWASLSCGAYLCVDCAGGMLRLACDGIKLT